MRRKDIFPIIMICIATLGLATLLYFVLSIESLEIRREAEDVYEVTVFKNINDCPSGTVNETCFDVINSAITKATTHPVSRVVIKSGTYDQQAEVSGDSAITISITGVGKDKTIINNTSNTPGKGILGNGHPFQINNPNATVSFKDLSIKDTGGDTSVHIFQAQQVDMTNVIINGSPTAGVYYDGSTTGILTNVDITENRWGLTLKGSTNIKVYNSLFEDQIHQGLYVADNAKVKVYDSRFEGNAIEKDAQDEGGSPYKVGAIQFFNDAEGLIKDSKIVKNKYLQIVVGKGRGEGDSCIVNIYNNNIKSAESATAVSIFGTSRVEVKNNVISSNDYAGIAAKDNSNVLIENNTIDSNGSGGVVLYDAPDVELRNNIISNNRSRGGVFGRNYDGSLVIDYNDVWGNLYNGNPGDYVNEDRSTTLISPGAHDISYDPVFITDSNYHINTAGCTSDEPCQNNCSERCSPAYNAGDPREQYNDLDGSRNDMGAYGGTGGEKIIPNDIIACNENDDCEKVESACCPCRTGGGEVAINKNKKDEYNDWLNCPEDVDYCPDVYNCTNRVAYCDKGQCALKELKGVECKDADLWGNKGKSDGIVNMFDLSYCLARWKSDDANCDLSGKDDKPDGIVNLWDILVFTQRCWKKNV